MTREEEIEKAIYDYSKKLEKKMNGFDYFNHEHIEHAFIDGIEWADNNLKSLWISVEESLPKEDPERNDYMSVEVLTITDKGYINLDTYDYQTQRWFIHSEFLVVDENDDSLGEVTHWLPIPELPKE